MRVGLETPGPTGFQLEKGGIAIARVVKIRKTNASPPQEQTED
jgi:hypothetical protein